MSDMYIKCIEKLLNDRDIKKSQYAITKKVCEGTLREILAKREKQQVGSEQPDENSQLVDKSENNNEYLKEDNSESVSKKFDNSHGELDESNQNESVDSEKFFVPFEMACKGDCPKVTIIALDALQKLIAHGALIGNYPDSAKPNKRLIDRIVETICTCFNGKDTDEGVELQIIKALLTVVTSPFVEIHEGSLLLTLRTCFNINLSTNSSTNQVTSKAMLTQMVHSLFSKVEGLAEERGRLNNATSNAAEEISSELLTSLENTLKDWDTANPAWFAELNISESSDLLTLLSSLTLPKPEVDAENETESKSLDTTTSNDLLKDVFLVFWALCKLAMKTCPETVDNDLVKNLETKSKVLAFQLLKSCIENCDIIIKTQTLFLTAVKRYLLGALMENAVSKTLEIYQINLDILVLLVLKFRDVIVDELYEACDILLMPVLDPQITEPPEYRLLALGAINKIFSDSRCVIDIFAMHDLQSSVRKLFESLVRNTCKLTEGDSTDSWPAVRVFAIESISNLILNLATVLKEKPVADKQFESCESSIIATDKCRHDNDEFAVYEELIFKFLILLESLPDLNAIELDLFLQKFTKDFCSANLGCKASEIYSILYSCVQLIGELSKQETSDKSNSATREWFMTTNNAEEGVLGRSVVLTSTTTPLLGNQPRIIDYFYNEIEGFLRQRTENRKRHISLNNVVKNAKKIITTVGLHQSPVSNEKQVRYVRRMFKVIGLPILNSLMEVLINCEDSKLTDVCLASVLCSIHISSVLNLKTEQTAFVQCLCKLANEALKELKQKHAHGLVVTSKTSSTTVTDNGVTKIITTTTTETKCRNVDIVQSLLNMALNEGNYLGGSWLDTLKYISQLEASDLVAKKNVRSTSNRSPSPASPGNQSPSTTEEKKSWYSWAGSLVPQFWDNSSNKLDLASVKESLEENVNKIFLNSVKLDDIGILEFYKALCQVSLIEITHPEAPRSFVYEKLFEVAHYNLYRPCKQWLKIWKVLSDYFCHLACSSDEDVAVFAIDSVMKLVERLILKEVVDQFNFQEEFLNTFYNILLNAPYSNTRDYVLENVFSIIKSCHTVLKSGWKVIFRILESSMTDFYPDNFDSAYIIFTHTCGMMYDEEITLGESYPEFLKTLRNLSFKYCDKLQQTPANLSKFGAMLHYNPGGLVGGDMESDPWLNVWFPFYKCFADTIIGEENYDYTIKAFSLTVIFDMLKSHGEKYKLEWFQELFSLLNDVLINLGVSDGEVEPDENVQSECFNKYYCYYYVEFGLSDTYVRHFNVVGDELLESVLSILISGIKREHEQIALSGVQCLNQIVRMLCDKFKPGNWEKICDCLCTLNKEANPSLENPSTQKVKWISVVQLEIARLIKNVLVLEEFSNEEVPKVLNETNDSSPNKQWGVRFNIGENNIAKLLELSEARMTFLKTVILSQNEMDYTHDVLIADLYFKIIFSLLFNDESNLSENLWPKLKSSLKDFLKNFAQISSNHQRNLFHVLEYVITQIQLLSQKQFEEITSHLYCNLCDLMDLELGTSVSRVLSLYFLKICHERIRSATVKSH